MTKYRIKEIIIPQFNRDFFEIAKPAIKKYLVEKRFLWFWWIKAKSEYYAYPNPFQTYTEAIEYISRRGGKLFYIC